LNGLLNLQLDAANLWQPQSIIGMATLLFVIGILGGSYPAFFLSSFKPVSIMKGKTANGAPLRRILVGVQFAVVIFVLVSTGMIYEQLQFLRNKDLGFNQKQVVRLAFSSEEGLEKLPVLKNLLKESPLISSAGTSSFNPGVGMFRRPFSADGSDDLEVQFVYYGDVDYDYFETMEMEIIAGRNFSTEHADDAETKILVNETFGRQFGLNNLIGQKIRFGDKNNPDFVTVIGVVKDFHQSNLHDPIAGQAFILSPSSYNLAVKIDHNIPEALAHIEKSWAQVFPAEALDYRFMDDVLQEGYETDQIRGRIFLLLSVLTILITFLGLFGLASYMVSQRIKEIGIRRVLGATLSNVVTMVAKDFLILVALAALPAFGLAWYFINEWLQDFAYQTEINYVIFGLVLLGTFVLTLGVTGLHAVRATGVNPAESLKNE
jgi:putative ABC transport system permease protein